MEEYKFPDEIENKNAVEDSFDIEIEDDTPVEDRNRTPMPAEIVENIEKDELDDYDEKAKQRIVQLKKVYHDERREKERYMRENNEALDTARRLHDENQKIKSLLNSGETEYVAAVKNSTQMELDMAKQAYRDAYESGDTDKLIEAQELITRKTVQLDRVQNFKVPPLQEQEFKVQTQQQPNYEPDDKVKAWQKRNTWFGDDEEMTAAALGLHEKLKRNGVVIGSDDYYATLDKTMRKRFPENFEEPEAQKPKPTVVASASRTTSSKKIKLNNSQVAIAKKLGLTPEQYVRELLKLES
jgi:hypothetical protein